SSHARTCPQACARRTTRPARVCRWSNWPAVSSEWDAGGSRHATREQLSLLADQDHRFVGALAVEVPELLEVGPVEIGKVLADIDQCGLELIRFDRLADGGAQRR